MLAMKFLPLLILSSLVPLAAHAQVNATSDYLSRMDSDGDGRISLVEYQDWMSYAFDAMDRNGDGTLTPDELPGGKGKPVTRAEYRARIAATFNKQDVNRDGSLSARELSAPPQ
ncbi:EF-hand domain-containing protein [Luteimonas lutimaris]|uniref:EF-hand domain-containing protein n=1 Tax=Luteimonas lutimaris TaxID=698645 RepID=A0ABP7M433_9GAMM